MTSRRFVIYIQLFCANSTLTSAFRQQSIHSLRFYSPQKLNHLSPGHHFPNICVVFLSIDVLLEVLLLQSRVKTNNSSPKRLGYHVTQWLFLISFFSVPLLFDSPVIVERVSATLLYPRFAAAQFPFLHCHFNFCESDLFCRLSDSDRRVSITVESE